MYTEQIVLIFQIQYRKNFEVINFLTFFFDIFFDTNVKLWGWYTKLTVWQTECRHVTIITGVVEAGGQGDHASPPHILLE